MMSNLEGGGYYGSCDNLWQRLRHRFKSLWIRKEIGEIKRIGLNISSVSNSFMSKLVKKYTSSQYN